MVKVSRWPRTLGYILFFSFLWWVLSEGSTYQLLFGAVVVIAATISAHPSPHVKRSPLSLRIRAISKFIPYFIFQSLKGGVLVARLALIPQNLVHSKYIEYEVRIPRDDVMARMCFASCLCIFPGTLSCGYREDKLAIHVLDDKLLDLKAIKDLEQMTISIFVT